MLRAVVDVENDRHLRIEAAGAERREVRFGIKNQPVSAVRHLAVDEEERLHAPVSVSPRMAQLGPALVSVLHFERYRDAACGVPRDVSRIWVEMVLMVGMQFTKEVTANYEEVSNFFSRNSVILLCSAAAMGSSVAAS